MNTIIILNLECDGCPMIWNCLLPDGTKGYIKYRWGEISLKPVTEKAGLYQEPIISEQIGDDLDGMLELSSVIDWLNKNGYEVENKIL